MKPTQAIQTDSGEDENNEESEEIAGFSGGVSPVFESNQTRSPSPVFPSQSLLATKKSAKRSLYSDDMFGPTQNIESHPSTQSPNPMTKYLSGDSMKIDSPGSFQSVDELAGIANLDTFQSKKRFKFKPLNLASGIIQDNNDKVVGTESEKNTGNGSENNKEQTSGSATTTTKALEKVEKSIATTDSSVNSSALSNKDVESVKFLDSTDTTSKSGNKPPLLLPKPNPDLVKRFLFNKHRKPENDNISSTSSTSSPAGDWSSFATTTNNGRKLSTKFEKPKAPTEMPAVRLPEKNLFPSLEPIKGQKVNRNYCNF